MTSDLLNDELRLSLRARTWNKGLLLEAHSY